MLPSNVSWSCWIPFPQPSSHASSPMSCSRCSEIKSFIIRKRSSHYLQGNEIATAPRIPFRDIRETILCVLTNYMGKMLCILCQITWKRLLLIWHSMQNMTHRVLFSLTQVVPKQIPSPFCLPGVFFDWRAFADGAWHWLGLCLVLCNISFASESIVRMSFIWKKWILKGPVGGWKWG